MIAIPLTQNQTTYVDDEDFDLAEMKWYAQLNSRNSSNIKYRAQRNTYDADGKHIIERMHRVIMSRILGRLLLRSEKVDHRDLDPLHNWRGNLRLATTAQNGANRGKQSNNTSGYKGVSWHKASNKWRAVIKLNMKHKHLGVFHTPEEAYEAYCKAAKDFHGEFANPGKPERLSR